MADVETPFSVAAIEDKRPSSERNSPVHVTTVFAGSEVVSQPCRPADVANSSSAKAASPPHRDAASAAPVQQWQNVLRLEEEDISKMPRCETALFVEEEPFRSSAEQETDIRRSERAIRCIRHFILDVVVG
jgi:hypothetical protein